MCLGIFLKLQCFYAQSGTSSLYPGDMESMYDEPLLFKVGKKLLDDSDEAMVYEVLG